MSEARQVRFTAVIVRDEETSGCGIGLPFEPKDRFGKTRVPVVVTLRGHSYRTTIFTMCGQHWVPLSKKNQDAAGVKPGDKVRVAMVPDDTPRVVEIPEPLAKAMRRHKGAKAAWDRLSFTNQREIAESILGAKRDDTRARRIDKAIAQLTGHTQ